MSYPRGALSPGLRGGGAARLESLSNTGSLRRLQGDERRPPAAALGWGIGEAGDHRMPGKQRSDDGALGAGAAAVDHADLPEAGSSRGVEILVDNRGHVARRERVEID